MHFARKRFGQHFLHDPGVIQRIVAAIDPRPGERLVEIGPGLGAITLPLLARLPELHAVEIDRDAIRHLRETTAGNAALQLHEGDALEFDFAVLNDGRGLRSQAMVFQRPFLLRLSVWRNLMLALWLARVPPAERAARAQAALERVGLARERERPARVLSGGQQQRLALARAWAVRPEVLFLDEPTASLDPGAKREVEALIESFARDDGVAIVMSTHNLGQAKRLGTRVLYLEAGRVLVDRPTPSFFDQPLPAAAALFVRGELVWGALPP